MGSGTPSPADYTGSGERRKLPQREVRGRALTENWFLRRDALQCKERYCDCMSSVRPSVCPSVGPNIGGSGAHRLEILETNGTHNQPSTIAFCSPKAIHLLPGNTGKFGGTLEVG